MAQKADKAGEVLASRKNELTVVAQDRNWRSYVSNELRCADQWAGDWGFLGAQSNGKFDSSDFTSERMLKPFLGLYETLFIGAYNGTLLITF